MLYQDVRGFILNPARARMQPILVLGGTLALFIVSMMKGNSARALLILVGVLFFHELGHWVGMRLFGYRDVKMFFIPFFGAAVSGKNEGAPQWQQAIVLLLGPMPGIILGCSLLFWNLAFPHSVVLELGCWLVGLNAFNLLPLVPLDGGRLLNLIIFSRHRILETVFLAVTASLVIGLGLWLKEPIFALLGVGGLAMIPMQYRSARAAEAIRQRWPVLPTRLDHATEPQLRDIFLEARRFVVARSQAHNIVKPCAQVMTTIHERALVRPVGLLASLGLLATYAGGFVLSFASVIAVFLQMGHNVQPPH
jgi:Zn-dependent protease